MKVTLDLNAPFLALDGKEMLNPDGSVANIGKVLSNLLYQGQHSDPMKMVAWAHLLWNGAPLELDPSDARKLRDTVLALNVGNAVKYAIIEKLDSAERAATTKPTP